MKTRDREVETTKRTMRDTPRSGITLITPSFSGDLPLYRRLAESVDRLTGPEITHLVVVPARDLEAFRPHGGSRTRLVAEQDILPARFFRLPRWLNPLLSGRNIYVRPGVWMPVRGWILQQIVKFAAALSAPTETVVMVDSDVTLLRPLTDDVFRMPDGRFRLFREPGVCGHLPAHQSWYRHAARVLDLPDTAPFWGDNYIDDLVLWRQSHVRGVLDRLETVSGRAWWKVLGESKTFSEYMLYGIYVTNLLGGVPDQGPADSRIHLTSWDGDLQTAEGRDAFVDLLKPHHRAVAIQSQEHLDPAVRDALLASLTEKARQQGGA